jgi:hypothetical protein
MCVRGFSCLAKCEGPALLWGWQRQRKAGRAGAPRPHSPALSQATAVIDSRAMTVRLHAAAYLTRIK